ncbi:hypothetical protein AB0C38_34040 [Amycolatopsis sp. NPDC048633]|uniref:hypothetical protein n=1 Tax=Amycolatopsis sp. NPDC048633 TaxID=3157095 RepID=UPI0033DE4F6D
MCSPWAVSRAGPARGTARAAADNKAALDANPATAPGGEDGGIRTEPAGIGLACVRAFREEGAREDLGDPAFPAQQAEDVARQVLFPA